MILRRPPDQTRWSAHGRPGKFLPQLVVVPSQLLSSGQLAISQLTALTTPPPLCPTCTRGQARPIPAQETRQATRGSLKYARGGTSKRRGTPAAASTTAHGEAPGRRSAPAAGVAATRGGRDTPGRPGSSTNGATADGFSSSTTTVGERYGGSAGGRRSPGRTGRVNGVAGVCGSNTVGERYGRSAAVREQYGASIGGRSPGRTGRVNGRADGVGNSSAVGEGRHWFSVEGRKPPGGARGGRSTRQPETTPSSSPRAHTATGSRNNAPSRGASRRDRNSFSAGNTGFSRERGEGNHWNTAGSGATAAVSMPTRDRRPKLPEAKKLAR